jgi:hypothetical protein
MISSAVGGAVHVASTCAVRRLGHQDDRCASAAGAASPAAAMDQHLWAMRQICVDHEHELRQIEPARRDIGRNAHPRTAVTQRLERGVALALAELARQRDHGEPTLGEVRGEVGHAIARRAEYERAGGVVEPQQVHDRKIALARHERDRAILDVVMAVGGGRRRDPDRVALVPPREPRDRLRDRRREQQCAALDRRGVKQTLEVLAEAHVEHLVGLVEHDRGQLAEHQHAAIEMIAQPARRTDDDVHALAQRMRFAPRIHAADARRDASAGIGVQPGQLALDLERELAGRRHDQGARGGRRREPRLVAEQSGREREPERNGFSGAGLRRDH